MNRAPSQFGHLTPLLSRIRADFRLDWTGIHGIPHWKRVHQNGVRIAGLREEADLRVIELFSYLHDSCRKDDGDDPLHGPRAAEYARSLQGSFFDLPVARLDELCLAIRDHSDGQMSTNATIQTCWDSDRLDLWRVGVRPSQKYLSKEAWGIINNNLAIRPYTKNIITRIETQHE